MKHRPAAAVLLAGALIAFAGDGRAAVFAGAAGSFLAAASSGSSTAPTAARTETALFAGGCFWCVETAFEKQPGVLSVVSGYSGGAAKNPTYENYSPGGHVEVVEVTFDPAKTSYGKLLSILWHNIDPTDAGGQFCDRGKQYRSEIFWRTEAQRKAALASKKELAATGALRGKPIVTEVVKAGPFWPAEEYHQDFWKKDPDRYFSYRKGCGRDERLRQLWGDEAGHSLAY